MRLQRASGILLHPTSLPGRSGIGDLGEGAYRFVDFLAAARQRLWQVMPLGPTGYGDSPYQCLSAFAGNPLLISLEALAADGLVTEAELAGLPAFPLDRVDFGAVIPAKWALLQRAAERFATAATPALRAEFERFRADQQSWLDDFALFMALKEAHGGAPWYAWEPPLRRREPAALDDARRRLAGAVRVQQFVQWQFARQWEGVRDYAYQRDIRVIGDIPIFVAYDSADVWANPDLFYLDDEGAPTIVAGVPPDYFSATGQLWGNPLYRWDRLAADGYRWWLRRFQATLAQVDLVRLDHFRGFEAYWAVPAGAQTAVNGRWQPGPGADFFRAVRAALGDLPIIAEDLGVITPPVEALRDAFDLPGMAVLQFAFGGDAANIYLPHNHRPNLAVYTGTHDNDTTTGWYAQADAAVRHHVRCYLGNPGPDIAWDFIRLALASVADTAVVPLQDVLSLGSEARMNLPGAAGGNWSWRYRPEWLTEARAAALAELVVTYGRDGVVDRERARRAQAAERAAAAAGAGEPSGGER
jgi:4-alpha-glucanotransferase